jgi:Raf kinase inhibitor-like YbhB/YbcL family protein
LNLVSEMKPYFSGKFSRGLALLAIIGAAMSHSVYAGGLTMASPAIADGARIPSQYTCKGADQSPALAWSGAPAATRSFALIVDDPDAPGGTFVHWVVYDLPASATGLPEATPQAPALDGGGRQGTNGFGRIGYNGPCPPPGRPHHYHFRLFALDSILQIGASANATAVEDAMRGHVIATAELVGIFGR